MTKRIVWKIKSNSFWSGALEAKFNRYLESSIQKEWQLLVRYRLESDKKGDNHIYYLGNYVGKVS